MQWILWCIQQESHFQAEYKTHWSTLFLQTQVSNADSFTAALFCLYHTLSVSRCCCVVSEYRVNDGTYKFAQATEGENSASLLWRWKYCCKSSNIFTEFLELLCSTGVRRKITAPGSLWIIAFHNSTRKKACQAGVPPKLNDKAVLLGTENLMS